LDSVQQEQLKVIGTYLSQIRQEQDRSLEDIAAKTYIPLRLLKAIEAGQDKPLPEPVFIQGFIRRYADLLGLDGQDLAQKFPIHVTPLPTAPVASGEQLSGRAAREESSYRSSNISPVTEEQPLPRRSRPARPSGSAKPYLVAALLLGIGGIALGVVRAISSRQVNNAPKSTVVLPQQPKPSESVSPIQSTSSSLKSPASLTPTASTSLASSAPSLSPGLSSSLSPSPVLSSTISPTATDSTAGPVSVALNLTGESWVQVTVDGQVKTEAVLPKGTQQSWSGKKSITVVAGNAGAVTLAANGGTAKTMGTPGDVKELTVTPKTSQ
jgi:cytoskeletal protein RodZ